MLFSENTISSIAPSSKIVVEADMSYDHISGLDTLRLEQYEEEYNLFIEMCKSDIKEIRMLSENAEQEQIAYHEEVSLKSIQEQLLRIFDRIVAAIQGAYKNFITAFERMLGRIGRDFLRKHHDEIYNKDIAGLKFDYQKPIKGSFLDRGVTPLDGDFLKSLITAKRPDSVNESESEDDTSDMENKEHDKDFYTLCILRALCNNDNNIPTEDIPNSFPKYFHENNFEKEEKDYNAVETELDTYFKFIDLKFLDEVKDNLKSQMNTFKIVRRNINGLSYAGSALSKLFFKKDSKISTLTDKVRKHVIIAIEGINMALTLYNKAFLADAKFAVDQSNMIMHAIYNYKQDEG